MTKESIRISESDVLELRLTGQSHSRPYVVEKIEDTQRDGEDPRIQNSKVIEIRKLEKTDTIQEQTDKDGNIVFRVIGKTKKQL